MHIIGSGLAGCIAANVFPTARVFEQNDTFVSNHKALLRFRTDAISHLTGIPFKKVRMQKSIWYDGQEVLPSPRMTAMYSKKVSGIYQSRSISKIEDDVRYIAPDDFHAQLVQRLMDQNRISFGIPFKSLPEGDLTSISTISTIPIGELAKIAGIDLKTESVAQPIKVIRGKIKNCNMYCTTYFPGDFHYYRVSITGDNLIIELSGDFTMECGSKNFMLYVQHIAISMGIDPADVSDLTLHNQMNGKITECDKGIHKAFIHHMTVKHNIYSLGRFALWRNILLDDVLEDCYKIKKMIGQDVYTRRLETLKTFNNA